MLLRWRIVYFLVLLLAAGCFQQAGESLQPASSTIIPETVPAVPDSNDNTEQGENNIEVTRSTTGNADSATATFPPITIISQRTATPGFLTSTPLVAVTPTTSSEIPITKQVITPISPLMANVQAESTSEAEPASQSPAETTPRSPAQDAGIVTPSGGQAGTSGECTYTVQPGDNLYRIALDNDFSLQALRDANPDLVGDAPVLQIGQILTLPNCGETTTSAQPQPTVAPTRPSGDPNATAVPGGQSYTVRPGDTLVAIATRFGTTVRAIQDANNLADPNRLSVGQVLIIPVEN